MADEQAPRVPLQPMPAPTKPDRRPKRAAGTRAPFLPVPRHPVDPHPNLTRHGLKPVEPT